MHYRFKHPPLAGLLFDVKSGAVLWERKPQLERPIASLTKMMTALMVARTDPPDARVKVSRNAANTQGSATGLLPRGRKVPLEALLKALILISANDAAVALAEHNGGSVPHFIKEMNAQAGSMGLTCTHFTTPNGLRDRGNYSCPRDLAALARADLANKRIAEIAQTRYAKPRFPIKGKHLYLSNNHYFLQHGLNGVPGAQVTGLKTGFTDAAGSCYVTTARLGSHHLGLVLLHSPSPLTQVPALLRAGFEEVGAIAPAAPARSGGAAADWVAGPRWGLEFQRQKRCAIARRRSTHSSVLRSVRSSWASPPVTSSTPNPGSPRNPSRAGRPMRPVEMPG